MATSAVKSTANDIYLKIIEIKDRIIEQFGDIYRNSYIIKEQFEDLENAGKSKNEKRKYIEKKGESETPTEHTVKRFITVQPIFVKYLENIKNQLIADAKLLISNNTSHQTMTHDEIRTFFNQNTTQCLLPIIFLNTDSGYYIPIFNESMNRELRGNGIYIDESFQQSIILKIDKLMTIILIDIVIHRIKNKNITSYLDIVNDVLVKQILRECNANIRNKCITCLKQLHYNILIEEMNNKDKLEQEKKIRQEKKSNSLNKLLANDLLNGLPDINQLDITQSDNGIVDYSQQANKDSVGNIFI